MFGPVISRLKGKTSALLLLLADDLPFLFRFAIEMNWPSPSLGPN